MKVELCPVCFTVKIGGVCRFCIPAFISDIEKKEREIEAALVAKGRRNISRVWLREEALRQLRGTAAA